jgi:hypothetical protein
LCKETDATLRKEQVQIVYETACIVFGEDRFRPSFPELFTVCKVSFGADPGDAQGKLSGKVAPKAASPVLPLLLNWPTVYFANAFSPIKLSGGEDFGD